MQDGRDESKSTPPAPGPISTEWRSWSLSDWNRSLFNHFFESSGSSHEHPILRIPVAPEVLALVAGAAAVDAHEVRRTFVGHFRVPPRRLNRLFSTEVVCRD